MIITYPTGKTVEYMKHTIQVPHWVKYIALYTRQYKSANTSLIGFSKKPKLTKNNIWVSSGRQEEIGFCDLSIVNNNVYLTLEKVA
ncbi:hypothetical protein [Escherichia phage vB_EcoM_PD205]|nr:hypothetical protein [Escherichia phage vB_EcoM_PD205]